MRCDMLILSGSKSRFGFASFSSEELSITEAECEEVGAGEGRKKVISMGRLELKELERMESSEISRESGAGRSSSGRSYFVMDLLRKRVAGASVSDCGTPSGGIVSSMSNTSSPSSSSD